MAWYTTGDCWSTLRLGAGFLARLGRAAPTGCVGRAELAPPRRSCPGWPGCPALPVLPPPRGIASARLVAPPLADSIRWNTRPLWSAMAVDTARELWQRPPGRSRARVAGRSRRHGDLDRQHRAAREPGIQVRLRHRRRRRGGAARPRRGDHPHHLGQEGRAAVAARLAPEGVPRLADDDRAEVAQRALPAGRLPAHHLLLGPEAEAAAREPRRPRPRDQGHLRQARRADRGAEDDGRGGGRRGVRLRLGGHHLQGQAGRVGHRLLLVLRGGARPSGSGAEVPRVGGAGLRQLLRRAQLGRLLRRLVRLHPEGREVPDGALDLLPHQRGPDGAVRADPARGRRGRHRELPGGLHGADARREPASRGGGRARGPRRRHHQVLDRPELVPRRQGRQGRHLQLRDQARQGVHEREDHVDAGRDRLGHHLEVPELHPAGRQLGRRVLLRRRHQQPPAGRHRHEDAAPGEEHAQHHRLQGHLGRQGPEHLPRPRADRQERQGGAELLAVRLAAHRRQVRRAHLPLPGGAQHVVAGRARGVDVPRSARTRSSTAASGAFRPRTRST